MKARCCLSCTLLQEQFGYIDEAAEPVIAEELNISRAEVHGVVSFYHDFRRAPAGGTFLNSAAPRPVRRPVAMR